MILKRINNLLNNNLYLPRFEIIIYLIIFITFLFNSVYNVFLSKTLIQRDGIYEGYTTGWRFLQTPRDNLDSEWERLKSFIFRCFGWFVAHAALSEIAKQSKRNFVSIAHFIVGGLFLTLHYNVYFFFVVSFKVVTFFALSLLSRKSVIWIYSCLWMIVINRIKSLELAEYFGIDEEFILEPLIISAWLLLRCISFCIDKINAKSPDVEMYGLKHMLGYVFYMPTAFNGPTMIYSRYKAMLDIPCHLYDSFWNRLFTLVLGIVKCCFWIAFVDYTLHYIYINNLKFNSEIVEKLNLWSFYGMGYLMGQYFHLHYVVSYGLGIAFAKFDGIPTVSTPKCIGRIHLYSDMWRHFDQGLYEFLFKYIYCCTGNIYRWLRSLLTFIFIYVWHGTFTFILIWSILNYVCLLVELAFQNLIRSQRYRQAIGRYLGRRNIIRLNAIIGSQIYIPSAMANFYFFTDVRVGNIFFERTYLKNSWLVHLFLTIICTCSYHVSEVIKMAENQQGTETDHKEGSQKLK